MSAKICICTLEPNIYDEEILTDGAMIIFNHDRTAANILLRVTIHPMKDIKNLRFVSAFRS